MHILYLYRNTISQQYENSLGQEITEDEEEAKYLAKRKMLGNIKFIGELGKLQIVHDSILHRLAMSYFNPNRTGEDFKRI